MLGYVLTTPSNSPFSKTSLLILECGYTEGLRVFFSAVSSGFPTAILKDENSLSEYSESDFQRLMLHCELNYMRLQDQSLPF